MKMNWKVSFVVLEAKDERDDDELSSSCARSRRRIRALTGIVFSSPSDWASFGFATAPGGRRLAASLHLRLRPKLRGANQDIL